MRPRDAPSATRTAISRARVVARASSRLATLAQAISNTSAIAASCASMNGRGCWPKNASAASTRMLHLPSSPGYSRASCRMMPRTSALAWATVTPGRRRASTPANVRPSRSRPNAPATESGVQSSAPGGKTKPAGMTPTIVRGTLFRSTFWPMTDGSAPKRRRHSPSLRMTTSGDTVYRASSSENTRPSAERTPSTWK